MDFAYKNMFQTISTNNPVTRSCLIKQMRKYRTRHAGATWWMQMKIFQAYASSIDLTSILPYCSVPIPYVTQNVPQEAILKRVFWFYLILLKYCIN